MYKSATIFTRGDPTLGDLLRAIDRDVGITLLEKSTLKQRIKQHAGAASEQTPLRSLPYSLTGGILGSIIAKYFKLGTMGQLLSSAAGFGVGRALHDKIETERRNPYRGFKALW